jgi:hypothetical protein
MAKYSDKITRVTGGARKVILPFEAWNCLITVEIFITFFNKIQYMLVIRPNFSRESDAKLTDNIDMKAFTSILCTVGALWRNKQSLEEVWDTQGDGTEQLRLVTNQRHFKILIRYILE